eukprot:7387071-Prymnesium_polylepis.2
MKAALASDFIGFHRAVREAIAHPAAAASWPAHLLVPCHAHSMPEHGSARSSSAPTVLLSSSAASFISSSSRWS